MEKNIKSYGEVEAEYRKRELKELQEKKGNQVGGQTKFRTHSVMVTTTVSNDFWNLAKQHNISWTEAMRVGISILLADKGHMQYDNKLNIWRKMNFFRQQAETSIQKVEELTEKMAKREVITLERKPEKQKV